MSLCNYCKHCDGIMINKANRNVLCYCSIFTDLWDIFDDTECDLYEQMDAHDAERECD